MANKAAYRQRQAKKGYSAQAARTHQCAATGKIGYDSRHQAAVQLHVLARNAIAKTRKDEVLQVFRCHHCGRYHLGHLRNKDSGKA